MNPPSFIHGVLAGCDVHHVEAADCVEALRRLQDSSVDLVFGSPPYEDARTYGLGAGRRGQEWVDWMVEVCRESQRVSRGLVAFVVEGRTRNYRWSATPALLMADLHRAGLHLRKPPIFQRFGVPGSGGPDWLRNDYEFIVCTSRPGKLPWSDNVAMGHAPKWAPGGAMSHRLSNGQRANRGPWGETASVSGATGRHANGQHKTRRERVEAGEGRSTVPAGERGRGGEVQAYIPPKKANPGNVVHCVVGGGVMGSRLCHENEAPFPERLAEFFIRSFCPPGGVVVDPFCGSGTTLAVALRHGRKAIGFDVRQSQVDLTLRRIEELSKS